MIRQQMIELITDMLDHATTEQLRSIYLLVTHYLEK